MAWYWPNVYTLKKAKTAAHICASVCFCFAVVDAVMVVTGAYNGVANSAGVSFIDVLRLNWTLSLPMLGCVLFTVAGWRIWNFSKSWAVIVLGWYLIQSLRTLGFLMMLFPPSLLLTFVLVTGVRGTFAYHWLSYVQPTRRSTRTSTVGQP